MEKLKGGGDRKFLQRNQLKLRGYLTKRYRNTERGKGIDKRELPQSNHLKPRKLSGKQRKSVVMMMVLIIPLLNKRQFNTSIIFIQAILGGKNWPNHLQEFGYKNMKAKHASPYKVFDISEWR